jgi:hypothetical protein
MRRHCLAPRPTLFTLLRTQVFSCCAGTGSYTYYIGTLNKTLFDSMDYAVNWDLSGRFFPCVVLGGGEGGGGGAWG